MVRFIVIFLFLPLLGFTQSNIEKALTYLQEINSEEIDFEMVSLTLSEFELTPISLNNFSINHVKNFPLLGLKHWSAIRKHIQLNGEILSINELKSIPFFSDDLIKLIQPFITLKRFPKSKKTKGEILYKIGQLIENPVGFTKDDSTSYLGNKLQENVRIKTERGNIKSFITWKKDKGENLTLSHLKGGLQYKGNKVLQQINLGSFSSHIAEGLIHSNKFISPKNIPPDQLFKLNQTLTPNASSGNYNYENGIAFRLKFNKVKSSLFFSKRNIHGSTDSDTLKTIKTDDYFRTNNDIEKLNSSNYKTIISSQEYSPLKNLSLSVNSKVLIMGHYYQPDRKYYNADYNFQNLINNSLGFRYFDGNFLFKGETAIDKEGDHALNYFLAGKLDQLELMMNLRSFSPKYNSFRTNTFSENSRVQNERGLLLSASYQMANVYFFGSYDLFSFKAPKYLVHLPSLGKETNLLSKINLNEQTLLKFFYRSELKMKDHNSLNLDVLETTIRNHFYTQIKTNFTDYSSITTRMDFVKTLSDKGYSAFIQFQTKLKQHRINLRLTSFSISNWDSRIYLYENDVLYNFSVPALNGKGLRFYINYNKSFGKKLTIWAKLGQFYYPDEKSIGSGMDEISGNTKTEFRIQLRLRI